MVSRPTHAPCFGESYKSNGCAARFVKHIHRPISDQCEIILRIFGFPCSKLVLASNQPMIALTCSRIEVSNRGPLVSTTREAK